MKELISVVMMSPKTAATIVIAMMVTVIAHTTLAIPFFIRLRLKYTGRKGDDNYQK